MRCQSECYFAGPGIFIASQYEAKSYVSILIGLLGSASAHHSAEQFSIDALVLHFMITNGASLRSLLKSDR